MKPYKPPKQKQKNKRPSLMERLLSVRGRSELKGLYEEVEEIEREIARVSERIDHVIERYQMRRATYTSRDVLMSELEGEESESIEGWVYETHRKELARLHARLLETHERIAEASGNAR